MTENSTSPLRHGRGDGGPTDGWTPIAAPVGATLYDVAATVTGAYAVGSGGVVLERADRGWRKVLDGVPGCGGADLYGADAGDDGRLLWLVGDDGTVCEYDVTSGIVTRHETPAAGRLVDVAVAGDAGATTVAVAAADGRVYRSHGADGRWRELAPGGAAPDAVALDGRTAVACADDRVVALPPDGPAERLGDVGDSGRLRGLTAAAGTTWAVGDDGTVCRCDGGRPVRSSVGEVTLYDVAATGDEVVAVGADGAAFARDDGGWTRQRIGVPADLHAVVDLPTDGDDGGAVARAAACRTVAVGADGTVVER